MDKNYDMVFQDFNPLPPCGGRLLPTARSVEEAEISIHSLRVEGDPIPHLIIYAISISIHSLRVEGDNTSIDQFRYHTYFNPLPPCGGRRQRMCETVILSYFNPLPPCGGRQQNYTAFRLKLSRANAILTKKNTDTLLHVRKNTFFLIFLRKSGCESLLLFLCA